ncbi:MAG TPA: hypothetical protein V6C63_00225 [Allocoleopsis sp.]
MTVDGINQSFIEPESEDDFDRKYPRVSKTLRETAIKAKTDQPDTAQSDADIIDKLQNALEESIRELRGAINTIVTVQRNIEKRHDQSKIKALESHEQAQLALSNHDMTTVFDRSVDKAVHIKVVQVLRDQADAAESKVRALKRGLTKLEQLKAQFQNQAKLMNFQSAHFSGDLSLESLKQKLDTKSHNQLSDEDILRGDDLSLINKRLDDL